MQTGKLKRIDHRIIFLVSALAFPGVAMAQERLYVSGAGLAQGGNLIEIPFTGEEINSLEDLLDITPDGLGLPDNIARVVSPDGGLYPLLPNAPQGLLAVRSAASPAGGNYVVLPLAGQLNMRAIGFQFENLVDAFGRPVELTPGNQYEVVFWIRPTVVQDTNGNRWFYDFPPTVEFQSITPGTQVTGTPDWSAEGWTEVTFAFTYDPDGAQAAQIAWTSSAATSDLVQVGGTGAPEPLLFLSTIGLGQIDYGPLLRFQTAAPVEVYPDTLAMLTELPTLRERLGRLDWPRQPAAPRLTTCKDGEVQYSCPVTAEQDAFFLDGAGGPSSGVRRDPHWMRFFGSAFRTEDASGTLVSAHDRRSFGIQAGTEIGARSLADGSVGFVDVTGHFVRNMTRLDPSVGGGQIATEALGIGLTGTWLSPGGFYLDGQAQVSWARSDLSAPGFGDIVTDHRGLAYALSVEGGRRIALEGGFLFTPQMQLTLGRASADAFLTEQGVSVSAVEADRSTLRLGAILERDRLDEDAGTSWYGLTNLYYTGGGDSLITANGIAMEHDRSGPVGEIGIGFETVLADQSIRLYGEVSAAASIRDAADSNGVSVTFGASMTW